MKRLTLIVIMLVLFSLPAALYAQDEPPVHGLLGWLAQAGAAQEAAFAELLTSLPHSRTEDGGFLLGDPDAPVTIVEFADWACPHCLEYRSVLHPILAQYLPGGQVNFEFRMFPTAGGIHTLAAGRAAECAEAQREGAFWEAYPILYELGKDTDLYAAVPEYLAEALHLDTDALAACMEEAEQIRTDMALAAEVGVSGTPAIMIRQNGGALQFISLGDVDYSRGAVPADVLEFVIATLSDT